MEALNKNKEEIEKILKEIGEKIKRRNELRDLGKAGMTEYFMLTRKIKKLKDQNQERIKTSILWCEDEIGMINRITHQLFHQLYEKHAIATGWETNITCKSKDFDDLPETNQETMIYTIHEIKETLGLQQLQNHLNWLKSLQEKKQ